MRVEERRDMEGTLVSVQEEDRVAHDEVVDRDQATAAVSEGWEEGEGGTGAGRKGRRGKEIGDSRVVSEFGLLH
jgi:hypothetical protein